MCRVEYYFFCPFFIITIFAGAVLLESDCHRNRNERIKCSELSKLKKIKTENTAFEVEEKQVSKRGGMGYVSFDGKLLVHFEGTAHVNSSPSIPHKKKSLRQCHI